MPYQRCLSPGSLSFLSMCGHRRPLAAQRYVGSLGNHITGTTIWINGLSLATDRSSTHPQSELVAHPLQFNPITCELLLVEIQKESHYVSLRQGK